MPVCVCLKHKRLAPPFCGSPRGMGMRDSLATAARPAPRPPCALLLMSQGNAPWPLRFPVGRREFGKPKAKPGFAPKPNKGPRRCRLGITRARALVCLSIYRGPSEIEALSGGESRGDGKDARLSARRLASGALRAAFPNAPPSKAPGRLA